MGGEGGRGWLADGFIDELIDLYFVGIKIVDPGCVFQLRGRGREMVG